MMFDDEYFCPICGGEELEQWHGSIYDCKDCGGSFDMEVFEEEADSDEL